MTKSLHDPLGSMVPSTKWHDAGAWKFRHIKHLRPFVGSGLYSASFCDVLCGVASASPSCARAIPARSAAPRAQPPARNNLRRETARILPCPSSLLMLSPMRRRGPEPSRAKSPVLTILSPRIVSRTAFAGRNRFVTRTKQRGAADRPFSLSATIWTFAAKRLRELPKPWKFTALARRGPSPRANTEERCCHSLMSWRSGAPRLQRKKGAVPPPTAPTPSEKVR